MQGSDSSERRLGLRSSVAAAAVDDGAVLLDLESKYFYALNGSGWSIVQMFEGGASPLEVAAQCRDWGADEAQVDAFVERLRAYELVEPAIDDAAQVPVVHVHPWSPPTIERQAEPLQNVIVSAFDPSIPLAE